MTYKSRKTASQQLTGISFVVALHIIAIYFVASGLAHQAVETVMGPIETKVIEEAKPKQEELPPPPPKLQTPPPYVPPPDLDVAIDAPVTESHAIAAVTNKQAPQPVAAPPAPDVEAHQNPKRPCPGPESAYPAASKRSNEEGTVTLALYIFPTGKIGEVKVERSSGFERLDDAALHHAERNFNSCMLPAMKDGAPIGTWKLLNLIFKLKK
jgi:protein TonB